MVNPSDFASLQQLLPQARKYFFHHLFSWATAAQIVVIACALLLARQISGAMRAWLTRQQTQYAAHPEACADLAILLNFVKVIDAFLPFIPVGIAYRLAEHFHWPRNELCAVGIILVALTVVRLFTDAMKNRLWAKILLIAFWGHLEVVSEEWHRNTLPPTRPVSEINAGSKNSDWASARTPEMINSSSIPPRIIGKKS